MSLYDDNLKRVTECWDKKEEFPADLKIWWAGLDWAERKEIHRNYCFEKDD